MITFEDFKYLIELLTSSDKEWQILGIELGNVYGLKIQSLFWDMKLFTKSNWLIGINKSSKHICIETLSGGNYYDYVNGSIFNLKELYEWSIERGVF